MNAETDKKLRDENTKLGRYSGEPPCAELTDAMIDPKALDELATRLSKLVPDDIQAAREDLSDNFRAVVQGWLDRMDLVTREEFDIQKSVLAKTRAKLEALEKRLDEAE